jgi:hypothetical protein
MYVNTYGTYLLHEGCSKCFCARGKGSAVGVEMRRKAQPKAFIERRECLVLGLGRWTIKDAREDVGHRSSREPDEVDCLEFEGLVDEV